MPKRTFPFNSDSHLQMKTHISEKEVNMGVKGSENMRCVYERTMDLLYKGARNLSNNNILVSCNDTLSVQPHLNSSRMKESVSLETDMGSSSSLRQMCISREGQLCRSEYLEIPMRKVVPVQSALCHSCSAVGCVMLSCCQFCERFCCDDCLKPCVSCREGDFCQLCSVNSYSEDGRQCLSCCK